MLDEYSDITKEPWKDIYSVNVYQFLNVISYSRYKAKRLQDQIKNKYKNY